MKRIALGIEYLGANYCGFQRQKDCPSVQGYLEKALTCIANEPVGIICAGRTDTGVNAVGQVIHFEISVERPLRAWLEGANTKLPGDIRISWAKEMSEDFHARFSAFARQYRYVIYNRKVHSAVLFSRTTWVKELLDVDRMHLAAQSLIGEHDYSSFRASACQANNAIRTIESISVTRKGDFIFIDLKANAFLHHMVRNIAGTLIKIGQNRADTSWVAELLDVKDRTKGAMTAPAAGLYFVNAFYPEVFEIPQVKVDEVLWV